MSDGTYSYASDSSERVADEMNILNKWMAQIVETGLPQISAQLAEIWGEQAKRRESDSEFLQTVGKLALVGVDDFKGVRHIDKSGFHSLGVESGVAEVAGGGVRGGLRFTDFGRGVTHFSFFLSGLACGLAITSLIRKGL